MKDFGKVQWNGVAGNYFGTEFGQVKDPQGGAVAVDLRSLCTLQAVTDAKSGQIVLQNPQPGTRSSLRSTS